MSMIIDPHDAREVSAKSDDQIQHSKLNYRAPKAIQLKSRNRQPLVRKKDDENASDTEHRTGGACAYRNKVARRQYTRKKTQEVPGYSGDQINSDQSKRPQQWLSQQSEIPQALHIGSNMQQSNMNERCGQQAPPLMPSQDERTISRPIVDQLRGRRIFGRDAVKNHPTKNRDVD